MNSWVCSFSGPYLVTTIATDLEPGLDSFLQLAKLWIYTDFQNYSTSSLYIPNSK